jgi:hypothetical protein
LVLVVVVLVVLLRMGEISAASEALSGTGWPPGGAGGGGSIQSGGICVVFTRHSFGEGRW